jgi:hypothetical protein
LGSSSGDSGIGASVGLKTGSNVASVEMMGAMVGLGMMSVVCDFEFHF